MARQRLRRRAPIALCAAVAGAFGIVGLYVLGPYGHHNETDFSTATVIMPDHNGGCPMMTYNNDTAVLVRRQGGCELPDRPSQLPSALRTYQNTLHGR